MLTPQGSAPSHTDPFQVATMPGLAGYKNYLDLPDGRKSTLDLLRRKIHPGGHTFAVLDPRMTAGGTNAIRWVSEFFGDGNGVSQFMGLRVEADLAEDSSSPTWVRWFTGRITGAALRQPVMWLFEVGDMVMDMDMPVFVGRVHASVNYVPETRPWPLGPSGAYGNAPITPAMVGTVGNATVGGGKSVTLDQTSMLSIYNRIADTLRRSEAPIGDRNISALDIVYTDKVRARLDGTDEYEVGMILNQWDGGAAASLDIGIYGFRVSEVFIRQRSGGPAIPADATSVTIELTMPNEEPADDFPLLINDVHCAAFLQDVAAGKFSGIDSSGAVRRSYGMASSISTFIADTTLPTIRGYVVKRSTVKKTFEEVCEQCGLAFRLDANGDIELVDMRLPTTLSGLDTLDDADIIGGGERWQQDRQSAITQIEVDWFVDRYVGLDQAKPDNGILQVSNPTLLKPMKRTALDANFGRIDLGDRLHTIKGSFIRAGEGEDTTALISRERWAEGRILALAEELRHPWGYGPQSIDLLTLRSARTKTKLPGDLVLVDSARMPDPQTNQRGGIRLLRVREVNEVDGNIQLRLMDSGPNTTLSTPTIGTLVLNGNSVDIPCTLDAAGDYLMVDVAVTDTSVLAVGSVPDNRWVRHVLLTTSKTITVGSFPSAMRVWVRGRSVASAGSPQLPSAYVYPTGADYVDMPTLSAPTGLAVSNISDLQAKLAWSVGGQVYDVEVHLISPMGTGIAADGSDLWRTLPPGSTEYWIQGTVAGATYRAAVRMYDGSGGYSPFSSEVTWTASGAAPVADAPLGLAWINDPGLP